jgi:signal peptidase I
VTVRRRTGAAAALTAIVVVSGATMRRRVRRYAIAEQSMAPALHPGDWVLAIRSGDPPLRGDIVVFDHPDSPGFELVKRVIGLPGETVTIANGQVHIDGAVLAEPWADGPTRPAAEWGLSADEILVLGDARSRSAADGRTLGPLPLAAATWRVRLRYWPIGGIGRVSPGIR